jgi:hypothetical protein
MYLLQEFCSNVGRKKKNTENIPKEIKYPVGKTKEKLII